MRLQSAISVLILLESTNCANAFNIHHSNQRLLPRKRYALNTQSVAVQKYSKTKIPLSLYQSDDQCRRSTQQHPYSVDSNLNQRCREYSPLFMSSPSSESEENAENDVNNKTGSKINGNKDLEESNAGQDNEQTSLLKRVLDNTIGRVWKALMTFLKILVWKPFQFLVGIFRSRGNLNNNEDEDSKEARVEKHHMEKEDEKEVVTTNDTKDEEKASPVLEMKSTIELETPEMIEEARIVPAPGEETNSVTLVEATEEENEEIPSVDIIEERSLAAGDKEEDLTEIENVDIKKTTEIDIKTETDGETGPHIKSNVEKEKELAFKAPEIISESKIVHSTEQITISSTGDLPPITSGSTEVSTIISEKTKEALTIDKNHQTMEVGENKDDGSAAEVIDAQETATATITMEPAYTESKTIIPSTPKGERWAVAAPGVDLSGTWKIKVTDDFKKEYDKYLMNLGQPSIVRSVAVSIVELTTEEIEQLDDGRKMIIKGTNLRGVWKRTLTASGSDYENHHNEDSDHQDFLLVTADKERVKAIAWWEDDGTCHNSWLRGIKKYGGGDFESRRYLDDNGNTLICESVFHPKGEDKEKASITWTFVRV